MIDLLTAAIVTVAWVGYMLAGIPALLRLSDAALDHLGGEVIPGNPLGGMLAWMLWPLFLLWRHINRVHPCR